MQTKIITRQLSVIAASLAGAAVLSGCIAAPLIVGGAAATTASVATDRRTAGTIVSDEVVEKRLSYEIDQVLGKAPHHITVTAYEGKVLLSGETTSLESRSQAEQTAMKSLDVTGVVNEIAVMDPASVTTRFSDSLLATKVRTSIIGNGKISLNQMKVVVERGIVYLMGLVTAEEAQNAAHTASMVSGVQKVVTCFTIATAEEIAERMKNVESSKTESTDAAE
ncbi:BON domain-containing protein [Sutterella sp.]|uniref:BON domain-containing protein n=1 Tax=Sutterella sp. TaxID=1981025 RepID=UPI0026DEDCB9|nr:BON domain-containing protein [Sutterella sp.]MDO5530426.1 BON domain-containing protein [Sutterella sp.]